MVNMAPAINTIIPAIFRAMKCRNKLVSMHSRYSLSLEVVCGGR